MAYVQTAFTEEGFITELTDLLTANGWAKEAEFRKVGYSFPHFFYSSAPSGTIPPGEREFDIWLADHTIFKNAENNLYGIARICKSKRKNKQLDVKFKNVQGHPDPTKLLNDDVLRDELHAWMKTQYDATAVDTSEIYFYMVGKTPVPPATETAVYPAAEARAVLDVENFGYVPAFASNSYSFTSDIEKQDLLTMQSPMMKVKTREIGTQTNGWLTNWWPDSKIRVEGLVSAQTVSLIIQADNTAAYDDNNVPTIPIYLGQLDALDATDTNEAVLFGGTAVSDAKFDYTSTTPLVSNPLLPLEKAYPKNPGNGIDNLIVKRTKFGAYYQAYYLSFQTAPDMMPPDRISTDGKQYVSSWKNERNDESQFKFSPSTYDGKTHVSRGYVVHPEEGVRGFLKDMIFTSSLGMINSDRLKLKKAACPDVFEIYKYFVVDAVSPLTKRPATPFSPAGFGIYEKEGN